MYLSRIATLAACLALGLSTPAAAEVPDDLVSVEVLPGWRTQNGTHMAGLRIVLAPGWKTYWRAPGDAGIPPQFDWAGSQNVAGVQPHWPVPHAFSQNGIRSIGYSDTLVLPLEIHPERHGDIRLEGEIDIGICQDVCVPVALTLAGELTTPGVSDPEIRAALANLPMAAAEAGVDAVRCAVEPISDGIRLTARIDMPRLGAEEIAILEASNPAIWVSAAEMSRDGATLVAVVDMVPPNGQPFLVDRSRVRITVIAGGTGVDIQGCAAG